MQPDERHTPDVFSRGRRAPDTELEQPWNHEDLAVHAVTTAQQGDQVVVADTAERDEDVMDAVIADDARQVLHAAQHRPWQVCRIRVGLVDISNGDDAILRVLCQPSSDLGADRSGADDQGRAHQPSRRLQSPEDGVSACPKDRRKDNKHDRDEDQLEDRVKACHSAPVHRKAEQGQRARDDDPPCRERWDVVEN